MIKLSLKWTKDKDISKKHARHRWWWLGGYSSVWGQDDLPESLRPTQELDCRTPVYVAQLGASSHCIPDGYAYPTHMELNSFELMTKPSLKSSQENDEATGPAFKALKSGSWPGEASMSLELSRLKREAGKLSMKGLLYRYSKRSSGETVSQMVLPKEFREKVMRAMHDDLGHLGQERTDSFGQECL